MALIEWQEGYSLGIPEIDSEHRELIDLINEAWGPDDAERDRDWIEAFLGEVHARIGAHFALEEKAMRNMKYGEYFPHKADHERPGTMVWRAFPQL